MAQEKRTQSADPPTAEPVPLAEQILDEVLPEELDWRDMVRSHPLAAILVAAAGGFWVARQRGGELLAAAGIAADREVSKNVRTLLDTHGPRFGGP